MANQFQRNYQLLELEQSSDWETANKNYRRLVHTWHPDRFAQRPRERLHAQQQFIELTKAFNNLRTFYRENDRLPYEQLTKAASAPPEPPLHQKVTQKDKAMFETGILNKRKPSKADLVSSLPKPLLWILPTGATVLFALLAFFVIDRNAQLNSIEEATRVLSSSKPSEYESDYEKISQVNSRSALLNQSGGGSGKMGDKLAKDLFR